MKLLLLTILTSMNAYGMWAIAAAQEREKQEEANRKRRAAFTHEEAELESRIEAAFRENLMPWSISEHGLDEIARRVREAEQYREHMAPEIDAWRKRIAEHRARFAEYDAKARADRARGQDLKNAQIEFEDDIKWHLALAERELKNGNLKAAVDLFAGAREKVRNQRQKPDNQINLEEIAKRIDATRERINAAEQEYDQGAARGGNNNAKSFYDKNKTGIWIGGGLFVVGIAYFVAQKLGWIGEEKQPEKETAKA